MKVGLFFGSFNPIHTGHLIIANHVLNETDLDKVWFIVSPQNPLKKSKTLLNKYHRLHLVRLAIEGDGRMRASDIEFGLPTPSYTVDTLTYLKEKYPKHEFSVIMGSDSLQNLHKWKNYEVILKNYQLYIYRRPASELTQPAEKNIHLLDAPLLEISATQIRYIIKSGKSIRYMVPENVMEEIEKCGYYKD
jgi:nicotinate-nucleotide adenylyltransferase